MMEIDEPAIKGSPAIHSVTSNSFHRKTKTGKIIKIVRERYLRKDIFCGRRRCGVCLEAGSDFSSAGSNLFSAGSNFSSAGSDFSSAARKEELRSTFDENARLGSSQLVPSRHFLIPDIDVIVSQMDVLEDPEFGNDVVILQTVLNEVRSKNLKTFCRLRSLISTDSRRFNVFSNEFHHETYSGRTSGEAGTDYSSRLVKIAHEWYNHHCGDIPVVLLVSSSESSSSENSKNCINFIDYVKSLKTAQKLVDKLALMDEKKCDQEVRFLYPEHVGMKAILGGVKKGIFFSGRFRTSRNNYLEGSISVTRDGAEMEVLIQGRININRAVDGDTVAIELLPENEWVSPSDVVLEPGQEEEEEELRTEVGAKKPTGKVVGIIRRNWKSYSGSLKKRGLEVPKSMMFTSHLFVPKVAKIPLVRIESRQLDVIEDQRIVVAIDSWPRESKYPKGHYVRSLGPIGEKEAEREALLLEHDVPYHNFSQNVLKCLPTEGEKWRIPEEEILKRRDLRDFFISSVDPPGCTDIDDALHCRELESGDFEAGVHIADVSFFIKPNSALDVEAASRGTTVYLVDKRIDMIPPLLSSNLCSLKSGEERLTFSVIWTMDRDTAQVKETKFVKSVIKSKAAMTYAEAQAKINSSATDELTQGLRRLNSLAKLLKAKRLQKGALVLANAGEIKFIEVESETHENIAGIEKNIAGIEKNIESEKTQENIEIERKKTQENVEIERKKTQENIEIERKEMLDTNSMVEEFMLLANISVAEKVHRELPELALLRRHPQPSVGDLDQVFVAARVRGFQVKGRSGKELSQSLEMARDEKNPFFNTMLRMLTTRCMTPAEYFCSGSFDSALHLNRSSGSFENPSSGSFENPSSASFENPSSGSSASFDPALHLRHFGLAADIYTHFTSPIRRYADLVVHRLLAFAIGSTHLDTVLLNKNKIQSLCENMNYRHKNAQYASRASNKLHTIEFIKSSKSLLEESAFVFQVKRNALEIFIPRLALELSYFTNTSEWSHNPTELMQTHLSTNISLKVFDPILIHLGVVDKSNEFRRGNEQIDMRIVTPNIDEPLKDPRSPKRLKK